MEIGQVIDFCDKWNEMHAPEESGEEEKPKQRMATQADWDRFL